MKSKEDGLYELLRAHEKRRCADRLERILLQYGPHLSVSELLDVLTALPDSYNLLPPFYSEEHLAVFYSIILSKMVRTRVRVELRSGAFTISTPRSINAPNSESTEPFTARPPFNAEYVLYLVLRKEERDEIIGDLIEAYGQVIKRFDKRRANLWFYKQVAGSLLPLLRRMLLRIGALVWLGRILRRLVS